MGGFVTFAEQYPLWSQVVVTLQICTICLGLILLFTAMFKNIVAAVEVSNLSQLYNNISLLTVLLTLVNH